MLLLLLRLFVCSATGVISYEFWSNIPGNNIWNFSYLATPTVTSNISMFEGPTDTSDNYASRIRGYLCPPADGNYVFWIAGDDATELWLSSDDDPSNKAKIAYSLSWTYPREWNKFSTQKSQPVTLATGKKYYIEALHKEGGGGDNLAVAWQLPDGFIEGPIPGSRLSPYGAVTALNQTIDFNALPDVTFSTSPLIISAVASSGLPVSFTVVSGPATVTGNIVTLKGVEK